MRISDWSSDVCSSDLDRSIHRLREQPRAVAAEFHSEAGGADQHPARGQGISDAETVAGRRGQHGGPGPFELLSDRQDALRVDRKSVGEGKNESVRLELGSTRIIKKKKKKTKKT